METYINEETPSIIEETTSKIEEIMVKKVLIATRPLFVVQVLEMLRRGIIMINQSVQSVKICFSKYP